MAHPVGPWGSLVSLWLREPLTPVQIRAGPLIPRSASPETLSIVPLYTTPIGRAACVHSCGGLETTDRFSNWTGPRDPDTSIATHAPERTLCRERCPRQSDPGWSLRTRTSRTLEMCQHPPARCGDGVRTSVLRRLSWEEPELRRPARAWPSPDGRPPDIGGAGAVGPRPSRRNPR